jgi:hypothetical protein
LADRRYHRTRWTWWKNVDLNDVNEKLKSNFEVELKIIPWDDERSLSIFRELNDQLKISADTIKAYATPMHAVIFQPYLGEKTERDEELIQELMKIYPRDRPSPMHLR